VKRTIFKSTIDKPYFFLQFRSSRPSKRSTSGTQEKTDSASSGEDDDEDAFEILTAENLFSTLLSRVGQTDLF
jgi:hypothetical protein